MPINPDNLSKLKELGLTDYQARAYLALLDLQMATASQLPALSGVPRTRIYVTMTQLHEKELVEIIPETPIKYRAVPIAQFLDMRVEELRKEAEELRKRKKSLAEEFRVAERIMPEETGRFEAYHGRRNVVNKIKKMISGAEKEVIKLGTPFTPNRTVRAMYHILKDKKKKGVALRYAFPINPENRDAVKSLSEVAEVRHVTRENHISTLVADSKEVLIANMVHDDERTRGGEALAIWTNDEKIARAVNEILADIWRTGFHPKTFEISDYTFSSIRSWLETMGLNTKPVLQTLAKQMGEEIASGFTSSSREELLDEIARYWEEHSLGRIKVKDGKPLTIIVEDCVDKDNKPFVGRTLCVFAVEILKAIVDKRLRTDSIVVEKECRGTGYNHCKFEVTQRR